MNDKKVRRESEKKVELKIINSTKHLNIINRKQLIVSGISDDGLG